MHNYMYYQIVQRMLGILLNCTVNGGNTTELYVHVTICMYVHVTIYIDCMLCSVMWVFVYVHMHMYNVCVHVGVHVHAHVHVHGLTQIRKR